MKIKMLLSILVSLILVSVQAQDSDIPNLNLKDLSGKSYNLSTLNTSESPIILSFWATWCGPCLKEMDALNEVYADWKDEVGVEIIAVSVDDARTAKRVKPLVNGRGWEFTFLADENQELKRRMNVANPPHLFIIHKGKIVYQHTGYTPGSEKKIYEELKKYSN